MNRFTMNTRPRLLLAYSDPAYASRCGRYFRRLGWEVRMVASGGEARRQVPEFHPTFMVIDSDLPDETGWLTCAKVLMDRPQMKVILQVPERDGETNRFMKFVQLDGVVLRKDGVEGLADAVLGQVQTQTVG